MLRFTAFCAALCTLIPMHRSASAQVYAPVSWSWQATAQGNTEADLVFTATIDPGWHVYALTLQGDDGPIPTSFTFTPGSGYKPKGGVKQGKYKTEYDPNFGMPLNYFEKQATFTQRIERLSPNDFDVKGFLTFMVCNDKMCLPPEDVEFSVRVPGAVATATQSRTATEAPVGLAPLGGMMGGDEGVLMPVSWTFSIADETDSTARVVAKATIDAGWYLYSTTVNPDEGPIPTTFTFEGVSGYALKGAAQESTPKTKYDQVFQMELAYFEGEAEFSQVVRKLGSSAAKVKGYITFMTCDNQRCLAPEDVPFELELRPGTAVVAAVGDTEGGRSNWLIFIISFFSGFAALLTPCVFPMIPLTVSYFTKQSKTKAAGVRNAMLYGLSIIVIYVLLGVAVTAAFGASALSELSTDPWFNLFFFLLLIVFAISFLGAFEITLPSSWINKADAQADRGGFIGIFFMAFTLALVSFSCTGPIVGTLIVEAAGKGGWAPAIGMLGFSLAIALPFTLFAAFPGWLNSLPQSGGWLNSVKVTLGFLELAFAFKFLSNADMVLQLHLLEREVFIAIWIVVFSMLTFYLLGKLKLSHDSDLPYVSVTRLFLALVTGSFVVYMVPGLWGAPLKLISAFPPPMHYSESPMGVGYMGGVAAGAGSHEVSDGQHLGPQNVYAFHDYDKGMAYAKKTGKPAMIDFTGHACVNCRKMEQQVWSDPAIRQKLAEDVVLISLYVDEKTPLPEAEQIEVVLTGGRKKKLRNVGHKWAAFQEQRYGVNAQPYYVLLDHNEQMLTEPANYQDYGTIPKFGEWLDRGVKNFQAN